MSLPIQELNACLQSYRLLIDLMQDRRVPIRWRREARIVTKHFPYPVELEELFYDRISDDERRMIQLGDGTSTQTPGSTD